MRMSEDDVRRYIDQLQVEERHREIRRREQADYSVFVSYAHSDKEFTNAITRIFDRRSIRYMVDEKQMDVTDHIATEVQRCIEACTHFLLVLSERSIASQWCRFEYGFATGAKKKIFIVLTNSALDIPPFAQPHIATANLDKVESYFAEELIDQATIDRFVAEIIDDPQADLERFEATDEKREGRRVWLAPDREQITNKERPHYMLDVTETRMSRLIRVELGEPASETSLLLRCAQPGQRIQEYAFSYRPDLKAVLVTPSKKATTPIGVMIRSAGGEFVVEARSPSIEESLDGRTKTLYGWDCSRDFWEQTLRQMARRLPKVSQ